MLPTLSKWANCQQTRPGAKVRLFSFPYAGGGGSAFRGWPDLLPPEIEFWTVQLPGREMRRSEGLCTDLPELVQALVYGLRVYLPEKPFAFFGHSMGALLAFELTRELRRQGLPQPRCLLVSGRQAPQLPITSANYRLSDAGLVEKIAGLEGTPAPVLNNPELLQAMLPILRSDFELCETYQYESDEKLNLPIIGFAGRQDRMVNEAGLEGWQYQTTARYERHLFPGNHFFIHTHTEELLALIARSLCQYY